MQLYLGIHIRWRLQSEVGTEPTLRIGGSVDSDGILPTFRKFLDNIDRGGLLKPSALAYAICLRCYAAFSVITDDENLKRTFLRSDCNHRELFCAVMSQLLRADNALADISCLDLTSERPSCSSGHCCTTDLIVRFFNTVASNYVRTLSNDAQSAAQQARKIKKLSSKS